MKVCQLADAGRILVAKHRGQIFALGNKCSHYGAPLERGVIGEGRVRCPWHGACFNLATGDIEDFPGLDGVPSYAVKVENDGAVRVRASRRQLQTGKRCLTMSRRDVNNNSTILVLGGGGAGASCVESLRQAGYTGRVILATREPHLPYDRPKLSKALEMPVEKLLLRSKDFYNSCGVEVLTCHEATGVDLEKNVCCFSNNVKISYDKLVIATGARPRVLDVPGCSLRGVFTLRAPEDGQKISAAVREKRLVVVGSSFIGMEVAAFCSDKALSVTVVGNGAVPFERSLGTRIGTMLQQLHEKSGVVVRNSLGVVKFVGDDNGSLTQVELSDGSVLDADVVVLGVGVQPCTEFLKGSLKLNDRGYIIVDETMRTSCVNVYAAGDVAAFPLGLASGDRVSVGHWQMAHQLGRVAARCAVGNQHATPPLVPFFWTQMFGKSIRYTGYCSDGFDDVVVDGDVEQQQFVAFLCRGDVVCAVISMGRDPAAAYWAEHMSQHGLPSKHTVQKQLAEKQ